MNLLTFIDPWIIEHPIVAAIMIGGLIMLVVDVLVSERGEAKKGA